MDEAKLTWVSSGAIEFESMKCPDPTRRTLLAALCGQATERIEVTATVLQRAKELRTQGLGDLDALHLACAERAAAAVLLTTDDRFLSAACRLAPPSTVRVLNPIGFAAEMSL